MSQGTSQGNLAIDPRLLKSRDHSAARPWRLWQKKSFNLHRGVIEWDLDMTSPSIDAIAEEIRRGVREEFRPGWFRGFGFGTILHLRAVPADIGRTADHIDRYNNPKGVWQWTILCFDREQVALGIHTWLHGYLWPVYRSVLAQLKTVGFTCAAVDINKGALFAAFDKVSMLDPLTFVLQFIDSHVAEDLES